jgi:N-methylhydantoinase B
MADVAAEAQPIIAVTVTLDGRTLHADFAGTSPALDGPLNAVRAIVESALAYVLRCLAGEGLPMNEGALAPLRLSVPPGSLLDPGPPHAVAGGNVETSQRVVDVLFGALAQALPERIPAASQGTMNNLAFGGRDPRTGRAFAYYETLGGGLGGGPVGPGGSGMHAHMSNTLNTPVEVLEHAYPVRVRRYALRRGSGGAGRHPGGEGLVREIEFLAPVRLTLLTTRRVTSPYGLQGGSPGQPGQNLLVRQADLGEPITASTVHTLPPQASLDLAAGDVLHVETPGGGGWGEVRAPGAGSRAPGT